MSSQEDEGQSQLSMIGNMDEEIAALHLLSTADEAPVRHKLKKKKKPTNDAPRLKHEEDEKRKKPKKRPVKAKKPSVPGRAPSPPLSRSTDSVEEQYNEGGGTAVGRPLTSSRAPDTDDDDAEDMTSLMKGLRVQPKKSFARPSVVPVSPAPQPYVINQFDGSANLLFYDDENFTLDDHLVRRDIYRVYQQTQLPHKENIRQISVFNFTEKHFEQPGATQWYHLKQEKLDLLCSLFSAVAFATGKKERKQSPDVANKRNGRGRGQGGGAGKKKKRRPRNADMALLGDDVSDVEDEEDDGQPNEADMRASSDASKEDTRFIGGNNFMKMFIETLVRDNRVCGFRIWLFDMERKSDADPLLCRGLKESLLEAAEISLAAKQQLLALATGTTAGGKGRGGATTGVTTAASSAGTKMKHADLLAHHVVRREYHYTSFADPTSHFMNVTKPYFSTDPCLSMCDAASYTTTNPGSRRMRTGGDDNSMQWEEEEDEEDDDPLIPDLSGADSQTEGAMAATVDPNQKAFRDDRAFMQFDTLTDEAYKYVSFSHPAHPCNMATLFCKEAAMINYVCDENIDPSQCRLTSYTRNATGMIRPGADLYELAHLQSDTSGTDAHLINRLNHAIKHRNDDSDFKTFPHPYITYHLPNQFLSQDFIARMPLPHRIGAFLYTDVERRSLRRHINSRTRDGDNDDDDADEAGALSASAVAGRTLYGMHQSECELTADLILYNPQHVDADTARLVSRAQPTRDIRLKFTQNKLTEIHNRLKLIMVNLTLQGRVFICDIAEEQEALLHEAHLSSRQSKKRHTEMLDSISSVMNYTNRNTAAATMATGGSGGGNDGETHVMDIRELPYISCTAPGAIAQTEKATLLVRLVVQRIRELRPEMKTKEMLHEERVYEELYYRQKVASGYVGFFREEIEKYRPFSNTLETIKTHLKAMGSSLEIEETFMRRNVFLRLSELNRLAYKNLRNQYFDKATGQIVAGAQAAYEEALRRLQDALMVEFFHEFFTNPDVSMATLGIRSDLLKKPMLFQSHTATTTGASNRKRIGTQLPEYEMVMDLRPWGNAATWLNAFIYDIGGFTHNYKILRNLYFAKLHHCRWHPECNNPKLNIILSGNGMAGKSRALQWIKKTCPTGVGDMVTHITDHAFNVDRDLNDIFLIYEEFQNKFLGYASGNTSKNASGSGTGGGVSVGSDKDTSNFFKARLTSGRTTTFSWYDNEETGKRDVKISHASVQGNLMGASNNDFTDADLNVLSRLILISVAKSDFGTVGDRPHDRTKSGLGEENEHRRAMYEQHREIHRVAFLVEKMIQSYVLGDNKYGVEMMAAHTYVDETLDVLDKQYGIKTNDPRKREYVKELARCQTLFYAVWMGLMSKLTRHLQSDPFDARIDIGFNPLVVLEGILPFLVVTKDQAIDAITSFSCLWYPDFQDLILEIFANRKCHLKQLRAEHFLVRRRTHDYGAGKNKSSSSLSSLGLATRNAQQEDGDRYTDYNYICMTGKRQDEITASIAHSLGHFQIAENNIRKLLNDLGRARLETDGYVPQWDEATKELVGLRLSGDPNQIQDRPLVEFTYCAKTGKPAVAILVQFLRKKLAASLPCDKIDDPQKETLSLFDQLVMAPDAAMQEQQEQQQQQEMAIETPDERMARIGEINAKTETLIIRALRDVMENRVLENWHDASCRALYASCRHPTSGRNPIMRYVTADPPPPVKITHLYPETADWIARTETKDADITFVDKLSMLTLVPREQGRKLIVYNHNTIAPSIKASLSIYKERNDNLITRRVKEYSEVEAWEVDRDLDEIACREHMRNIGNRRLRSRPDYTLINYPPSTYMALQEDMSLEAQEALHEYPNLDIKTKVAQRKRKLLNEANPHLATYPQYSAFVASNYARQEGALRASTSSDSDGCESSMFIGRPLKRSRSDESSEMVMSL